MAMDVEEVDPDYGTIDGAGYDVVDVHRRGLPESEAICLVPVGIAQRDARDMNSAVGGRLLLRLGRRSCGRLDLHGAKICFDRVFRVAEGLHLPVVDP